MPESENEIEQVVDDALGKSRVVPAMNVGPGTENGPAKQDDEVAKIRDERKNRGIMGEIL